MLVITAARCREGIHYMHFNSHYVYVLLLNYTNFNHYHVCQCGSRRTPSGICEQIHLRQPSEVCYQALFLARIMTIAPLYIASVDRCNVENGAESFLVKSLSWLVISRPVISCLANNDSLVLNVIRISWDLGRTNLYLCITPTSRIAA